MTNEALRLLERVHGHIGWLAAAALLHPAIVLRNPRRRARLSAVLSAVFATAAGVFGAVIYPAYSRSVRRVVYTASVRYGLLFERKEHLAFAAVGLAIAGCLLHLSAEKDEHRARAAHIAFVASAALTTAVAAMGTIIASFRSF